MALPTPLHPPSPRALVRSSREGGWGKDDEIINKYNTGEALVVCKYTYYRGGRIDQGMDGHAGVLVIEVNSLSYNNTLSTVCCTHFHHLI